MKLSSRYLVPLATLLIAGSTTLAQSSPVGWKLTVNMTTDSGDAAHRSSMAMRRYVTDGKVRMEIVQVSNMAGAEGAEGGYQIINAADSTITMVTPAQRSAMVMQVGATLAGFGTPKIEPHITSSQVEDLGAGDRILGHATRHVRATTEGTIDVTMFGSTCTGSMKGVAEMWIAPDVDLRRAMESVLATTSIALGSDMSGAVQGTPSSSLPSGTALRTISKVTRPNAQGRMTTVTTTSEYVELAQGPLDPSVFQVPADFKVMDMKKMMAMVPPGMLDSALRAGAEKGGSASSKAMCQALGSP
jgi:hypothetical protein